MRILYSFNKEGFEAEYWTREIAAASTNNCQFVPFNHGRYLNPLLYIRAQLLDNLYYQQHSALLRMYDDFDRKMREIDADAVIVDNCPPYHPDFLRRMPYYKVLRIADGPISAYDRDFAYLHAYDHILYHSPAYSRDMSMPEKLSYCGAKHFDFWPHALFDAMFDPRETKETILTHPRDVEVIFVGALHVTKMAMLAKIKKALGSRVRIHGVANLRKNVYYNLRYGFPGWVRPVRFEDYVPLYQRSLIGINLHNRGKYTVGSYRLFDLPGNGVMQISDGGEWLGYFFEEGNEIVGYDDVDDLIDKVRFYLDHAEERKRIALNGYRRVMKDHRFNQRMMQAVDLIRSRMELTLTAKIQRVRSSSSPVGVTSLGDGSNRTVGDKQRIDD
jgi:spore maturation protein CgeB